MGAQQMLAIDISEPTANVTIAMVIASPELGGLGRVSWSFLKGKMFLESPGITGNRVKMRVVCLR